MIVKQKFINGLLITTHSLCDFTTYPQNTCENKLNEKRKETKAKPPVCFPTTTKQNPVRFPTSYRVL